MQQVTTEEDTERFIETKKYDGFIFFNLKSHTY